MPWFLHAHTQLANLAHFVGLIIRKWNYLLRKIKKNENRNTEEIYALRRHNYHHHHHVSFADTNCVKLAFLQWVSSVTATSDTQKVALKKRNPLNLRWTEQFTMLTQFIVIKV